MSDIKTETFAKLFESESYGQILLRFDIGDETDYAIKSSVCLPEVGVVSLSLGFNDRDNAMRMLRVAGIEKAEMMVKPLFDMLEDLNERFRN